MAYSERVSSRLVSSRRTSCQYVFIVILVAFPLYYISEICTASAYPAELMHMPLSINP